MARTGMWMGTRDYADWVPACSINADFSSVGWAAKTTYLNGGAYVRRSKGSHKEYDFSWALNSRDELRKIDDLAKGLWGDGLIYFVDPFAMDKNVLPPHWAAPMMTAVDSPVLIGTDKPELVPTAANPLGYPTQTVVYNKVGGIHPTLYLPIPRGYTAWVGVHGPSSSPGKMQITPVTSPVNSAPTVALPMLAVTSTNRFSHTFNGDTYMGIEVEVDGNISYSGAMVQILKNGVTPPTGGFISGQGNSGCEFEDTPRTQAYSAVLDKVGMTAKLVEVGSWL
jgi:hypothetical protein